MHRTSVTNLFQALSQATTRLISTIRTVIELDEEAKKYNQNLPGMGGVFNHLNSN